MKRLPPSPADVLCSISLVLATCGGAALALVGCWLATHPEAGAALETARAVIYAGLVLAVAGAAAAQLGGAR